MTEEWTIKDEAEFRRLNRKRMKIYRDKNRKRKYVARIVADKKTEEKKP